MGISQTCGMFFRHIPNVPHAGPIISSNHLVILTNRPLRTGFESHNSAYWPCSDCWSCLIAPSVLGAVTKVRSTEFSINHTGCFTDINTSEQQVLASRPIRQISTSTQPFHIRKLYSCYVDHMAVYGHICGLLFSSIGKCFPSSENIDLIDDVYQSTKSYMSGKVPYTKIF